MALIPCPECSQSISDRSKTCPHCGFPLGASVPLVPAQHAVPGKSHLDEIKNHLEHLTRQTAEDAFLIIEEVITKKFVQFAGKELLFDLPEPTLSDPELAHAEKLLKSRYGIDGTRSQFGPHIANFQKTLGGNVELACGLVSTVFFEIYGFSEPCRLNFVHHPPR